ncbi:MULTISPECIES: GNAT family N-acetyltransferase [Bacillaceae]|uniref:GNAT family N-acetyltransferase n=1 Tax=Evansella alkalicola TaxID=745819 RepID=A0ABS6JWI6_9BACI|nr:MULTISPECIES: GNAT family N-acetyltransferase [Bacillaceae]MBU9722931.1 GNAT family N-acetyltransferase [Bacillus alkalicola]
MTWVLKDFQELDTAELYTILAERVNVFIVEQECPYPEIDGKDDEAFHLFYKKDGQIAAYARLFRAGDYYEEASIGRILVKEDYRKQTLGRELVDKAISVLRDEFNETKIKIQAQNYLREFYSSFGFEPVTKVYLEDDIPHVDMILEL